MGHLRRGVRTGQVRITGTPCRRGNGFTESFGRDMSRSFTRVGALRAAAVMTLSTYVTVALGLVVSAILARSLGPDD